MLKLKDITLGLIPIGSAAGQRAFFVDIEEDDIVWDGSNQLYDEFIATIKKNKWTKLYVKALDIYQETFFVFKSGFIEKNNNADELDNFHTLLSKEAVPIQSATILKSHRQIIPSMLRPPFCLWFGVPVEYSVLRSGKSGSVYDYFNYPSALLDSKSEYNQLGLQQLINAQYPTVCIKYNDKKDMEFALKLYEKYYIYRKIFIIDFTNSAGCQKDCIKYGFRYQSIPEMTDNFIKLI